MKENKFDTVKNGGNKNSIEEDIEILEEKMSKELDFLIENANKTEQLTATSIIAMKEPIILLFLSILSDYERVLKENEELKKSKITYERVRDIQIENKEIVNKKYISKQKIKEVIKELEENIYRIKKQDSNGGENCNTVYLENLAQVKILKQMLRESEE